MLLDLVLGSVYGLLVTGVALLAAIPYGIWRGLLWLRDRFPGRSRPGRPP